MSKQRRFVEIEQRRLFSCCNCGNRVPDSHFNFGDGRVSCAKKCTDILRAGQDGKGGWLCRTHVRAD